MTHADSRCAYPTRMARIAGRSRARRGAFFGAQPDTPAKLTGFAFAFERLEVAGYEQLRRVAERAGDEQTAALAAVLADEERTTADRIAALWDPAVAEALAEQGVSG